MNTSPDHPDFTALALGEHIHGIPMQAVLDALRTSVSARKEAEEIRSTAQNLAFALKAQPQERLDAARRHALFHADAAAIRARFAEENLTGVTAEPAAPAVRAARTWIYPTVAAAAVAMAAILVMQFLPGYTAPSKRGASLATEPKPTGKILVTSPPSGAPERGRVSVNPPAPAIVNQAGKLTPPDKGPDLPAPPAPPPSAIVKEVPPALPDFPAPEVPPAPPAAQPVPKPPLIEDYATPFTKKNKK